MKSVLCLVVFLGLAATVLGDCLIPGLQTAEARTNTNCAWYNSKSCCTSDQANQAAAPASDGCAAPSTNCQQLLTLFECGLVCSPDISSAFTSDSKLNLCSKFADHIYSSCSSSMVMDSTGKCVTLSSLYSDSKSYWGANSGVNYDTTDSPPTCFNAGSLAQPMFFAVVVAVLAMIFRF